MSINGNVLVTGGSGFLGSLLVNKLIRLNFKVVNIDLVKSQIQHENLTNIVGDIADSISLEKLFKEYSFDVVFHLAAILAHGNNKSDSIWNSNVIGTQNITQCCKRYNVRNLIFTSSNCLWAQASINAINEETEPNPVELYGKSKLEGERIISRYKSDFNYFIFRCPTIIDAGRLGLLGILFEFIEDNKSVWVVGDGSNKYQFIYAEDLLSMFVKVMDLKGNEIYNIGSDNVDTIKHVYEYVIEKSCSLSKVKSLPKQFTLFMMKVFYKLGLSPLGPYHYKMIAENFVFDTSKIKKELDFKPTLTNKEMLHKAFIFYKNNKASIKKNKDASAHRKPAKMGIIKILKLIS